MLVGYSHLTSKSKEFDLLRACLLVIAIWSFFCSADSTPLHPDLELDTKRFTKVSGTVSIYRGGYLSTEEQFQKMKASHVGTILSLQGGDWSENPGIAAIFVPLFERKETPKWVRRETELAEKYGIRMRNFPVNSLKPLDELTELYIEWTLNQLRESETSFSKTGEYLYLHCSHGADRTGLIVALYRVLDQGWSVEDAYVEWRNFRYNVNLVTTWPLDQFFFRYLAAKGFDTRLSNECIRALIM